jgi:hypothetical protein
MIATNYYLFTLLLVLKDKYMDEHGIEYTHEYLALVYTREGNL